MTNLSVGADMAWQIAAHEAAASGYRCIEKEHLLSVMWSCTLDEEANRSPDTV